MSVPPPVRRLARVRDATARGLLRAGCSPDGLTVAGLVLTLAAAVLLVAGAGDTSPWESIAGTPSSVLPVVAGLLLALAFSLDVLDGTVARVGGAATPFGALLDSSLDRIGDLAIFGGCVLYFARRGNLTYTALACAGAANAMLVSYVKARAECLMDDCGVGLWQRPERCVVFLAAVLAGHVAAGLWILGTLPALTVVRRIRHARRILDGRGPLVSRFARYLPWERPRWSPGYVLSAAAAILYLVAAPHVLALLRSDADPLRRLLEGALGG